MRMPFTIIITLALCMGLTADDYHATTPTEFAMALGKAAGGDVIHVTGTWDGPIKVKKRKYIGDPLVIEGDAKIQGLDIGDVTNLVIRGIDISGHMKLEGSYPEYGLHHIVLDGINAHDSDNDRLVFLCGSYVSDIEFRGCSFARNINGTHLLYITAGHWKPEAPPVKGIRFIDCTMGINPHGRHVIQFNGRFKDVVMDGCTIHHGEMFGVSIIGVDGGRFTNNVLYGNQKGGFVVYDYVDKYYCDPTDPEQVRKWFGCHHPNGNLLIENNTIVTGPRQFAKDPWHDNDPVIDGFTLLFKNKAKLDLAEIRADAIAADPTLEAMPWAWDHGGPVYFRNNVCVTPNHKLIEVYSDHEAGRLHLLGNHFWSLSEKPPEVSGSSTFAEHVGTVYKEIKFIHGLPQYRFIDAEVMPNFDWTTYKPKFDPFCWVGKKAGVGAPVKLQQGVHAGKGM